jgi:hypothetical protein
MVLRMGDPDIASLLDLKLVASGECSQWPGHHRSENRPNGIEFAMGIREGVSSRSRMYPNHSIIVDTWRQPCVCIPRPVWEDHGDVTLFQLSLPAGTALVLHLEYAVGDVVRGAYP